MCANFLIVLFYGNFILAWIFQGLEENKFPRIEGYPSKSDQRCAKLRPTEPQIPS
jgi:hypothetical protein